MRSLGVRASNHFVFFSIIEPDKDHKSFQIINIEEIKIPRALDIPTRLKYLRNTLLDILNEYDIKKAGIRTIENVSDNKSNTRIQIEGVIQEAFATSNIEYYFVGQSRGIESKLNKISPIKIKFKELVKSQSKCDFIKNWDEATNPEKKEAVLVGVGALV